MEADKERQYFQNIQLSNYKVFQYDLPDRPVFRYDFFSSVSIIIQKSSRKEGPIIKVFKSSSLVAAKRRKRQISPSRTCTTIGHKDTIKQIGISQSDSAKIDQSERESSPKVIKVHKNVFNNRLRLGCTLGYSFDYRLDRPGCRFD